MDNQERERRAYALEAMLDSEGGKILLAHIEQEIVDGWEQFISLSADQKTAKVSYDHQARYKVLKNLKSWLNDEIRLGKDFGQPT